MADSLVNNASAWNVEPGAILVAEDTVKRWEQMFGFQVQVPDWMIEEISKTPDIVSGKSDFFGKGGNLYALGQYMQNHIGDPSDGAHIISQDMANKVPGAFYGMTPDEYSSKATAYGAEYKRLTGQAIDTGSLASAFKQGKGQMSAADYAQSLQQDQKFRDTYGWVKYGLDWQQFQQHKQSLQETFGSGPMSDQQAVLQLQYNHANMNREGNFLAAHEAPVQPTPDMSKGTPASVGASDSAVR